MATPFDDRRPAAVLLLLGAALRDSALVFQSPSAISHSSSLDERAALPPSALRETVLAIMAR